jgi:hypothetical protein
MDGWQYLIAGAVCSCAVLIFLRTVACAIEYSDGVIKALEETRRRERKAAEAL